MSTLPLTTTPPALSAAPAAPAPSSREARLRAAVRARWTRLDWTRPIADDAFVMPEAHCALDLEAMGLTQAQRVGLNRLLTCFSCELFVHFEAWLIIYLERHGERIEGLSRAVIERFVAEERVHSEMFLRLLGRLWPGAYPASHPRPERALRFMRWTAGDDRALRLASVGTFFLLAWLFEEITLYVPRALDEAPEQSDALVADVMRLHAREEASHVALDARVLAHLSARRRGRAALEAALTLPMLVWVDLRVGRAWRALVATATERLGLSAAQRALLMRRAPTQSDRWGIESFIERVSRAELAGVGLLCRVLRWQLRAAPARS